MRQLGLLFFTFFTFTISAQRASVFKTALDNFSDNQNAQWQTQGNTVFVGGYNAISISAKTNACRMYTSGTISARLELLSFQLLIGTMHDDEKVIAFSASDSVFSVWKTDSLTLAFKYPTVQHPVRNASIDAHDLGLSPSGNRMAAVYQYDSVVTQYADSIGTFNVALQEILVSDAAGNKITEFDMSDLLPPATWCKKRVSLNDPFHINSIEFIGEDSIFVSCRPLGLVEITWHNGPVELVEFIGQDSLGASPILQHCLRRIAEDTYSFFSDGDGVTVPRGVIMHKAGQHWNVLSQDSFSDPTLRVYAMGSYQRSVQGFDLLNSGWGYSSTQPFGLNNLQNVITGTNAAGMPVFELTTDSIASYSAHIFDAHTWADVDAIDDSTFVAIHPFTMQSPTWYTNNLTVYSSGDTVVVHGTDTLFYTVEANDQSGWLLQSKNVWQGEQVVTGNLTITHAEEQLIQLLPHGVLALQNVSIINVLGQKINSLDKGQLAEMGSGVFIAIGNQQRQKFMLK